MGSLRLLAIAASAVFLAAILTVPGCSGAPKQTLKGKAVVISVTPKTPKPTKDILAINTGKSHIQVQFDKPDDIEGIQSGMSLEVEGVFQQPAGGGVQAAGAKGQRPTFKAQKIKAAGKPVGSAATSAVVVPNSDDDGVVGAAAGTPNRIVMSRNKLITPTVNTLFVPITAAAGCPGASKPKVSQDQLRKSIFGEKYGSGFTVASSINRCSLGNTKLNPQNSLLVDTVELPCAGTTDDVAWTFAKCDYDDFNGYASAANEVLKSRGINLDKYKYRVYYIPPGTCSFVGLGSVGCGDECRVWIGGDHWDVPQATIHELGHNLFFAHAGSMQGKPPKFDEYEDDSCSMGYCCGDRCWNTAHMWQAGWVAAQQLNDTTLKPGQTIRVNMASHSTVFAGPNKNPRYALRIRPTWAAGQDPIFVGYRTRAPNSPDSKLNDFWAGKVTVYTAPITNTLDARVTTWKANMAAGEIWEHAKTGLVLRFKRVTPQKSAVITVCRKGGPETATSCALRIDNDCNGLVGDKDPACQKIGKHGGDKTELR